MEVSLKSNFSFIWRSILTSRKLVRQGTRWIIGDGSLVGVMKDAWLRKMENLLLTTKLNEFLNSLKVSDLMITGA